jgi:hypothetical protein
MFTLKILSIFERENMSEEYHVNGEDSVSKYEPPENNLPVINNIVLPDVILEKYPPVPINPNAVIRPVNHGYEMWKHFFANVKLDLTHVSNALAQRLLPQARETGKLDRELEELRTLMDYARRSVEASRQKAREIYYKMEGS